MGSHQCVKLATLEVVPQIVSHSCHCGSETQKGRGQPSKEVLMGTFSASLSHSTANTGCADN